MKSVTAKPTTKSTNDLKECLALWNQTSKDKKTNYFTGKTSDGSMRLVAFINTVKTNPKQPDITIYEKVEKGKEANQVALLWENTSKSGKRYLSGSTNDNEKIIGFFNENTQNDKYPAIRVYYKDQSNETTK
ncbi:MAG: hypothetical protein J6T10_16550 [Methanobrevibacter sp.]|nr:hypothetical protein [Methanobrevibacter sp.]